MIYRSLCLVLSLALSVACLSVANAQTKQDSLRQAAFAQPSDTNQLNTFLALSKAWKTDKDSMLYYAHLADSLASPFSYPTQHKMAMQKGYVLRLTKKYGEAEKLYEISTERSKEASDDRGFVEGNYWLGRVKRWQGHSDSSLAMFEENLRILQELDWPRQKAMNTIDLGGSYFNLSRIPEAIATYEEGLVMARALGDSTLLGKVLFNLARTLEEVADYDEAMALINESVAIDEATGDIRGVARGYTNYGMMSQYGTPDYDSTCLYYYRKAYQIYAEMGDTAKMGSSIHNLGAGYFSCERYDLAMQHFRRGLEYRATLARETYLINSYYGISMVHYELGQIDSSFYYGDMAYAIAEKYGRTADLSKINYNRALCYRALKQYDRALGYFDLAIEGAISLNRLHALHEYFNEKAETAGEKGDYELAFEAMRLSKNYMDTFTEQRNDVAQANLRGRFDVERKERENLELQIDNQQIELANATLSLDNQEQQQSLIKRNYLLGGLIFLILVAAAFGWIFYRRKQANFHHEANELKHKLLRSQMNPHFIFNALMAIQGYMMDNDADKASSYLSKFARLTRQILEYSRRDTIALEEEEELLRNYLELQSLRFPEKFEYQLEIDPALEAKDIDLPPMLAQPFIENAIEHGLAPGDEKGQLNVIFKEEDGQIKILIEDDGVGMERSKVKTAIGTHQSLAGKITQERLNVFDRRSGGKSEVSFSDLAEKGARRGTKVVLTMPLRR